MRRQYTIVIEPTDHNKVLDLCEDPNENEGHYFIVRERFLSDPEHMQLQGMLTFAVGGIKDFRVRLTPGIDEDFERGLGDIPDIIEQLCPPNKKLLKLTATGRVPSVPPIQNVRMSPSLRKGSRVKRRKRKSR